MKVGIIGGGISGLIVAYQLQKLGIAYDLFEQAEQPGGNIRSVRVKDYILEMGPNALSLTGEIETLIEELKLNPEIIESELDTQKRYIMRHGNYQEFPDSPLKLATSRFFSYKTKLRLLQEPFKRTPAPNSEETVSNFFEKRFGKEVMDYAVTPFVSGIYAGDPSQLLLSKTFPQLYKNAITQGSVMKSLLKDPPARKRLISFKKGLQTLPLELASKLIDIHTGYPVEMITKTHGKFIVSTTSPDYVNIEYDVLVLALPAHKAFPLLEFTYPGLAAALSNINYPPVAIVHTVYRRSAVGFSLNGYGALHPKPENQFTAGIIWSSSVFKDKCPTDEVLFTCLIGGSLFAENTRFPRVEILQKVHEELKRNYQITSERPVFQHFYLWNHAIPQLDLYIEDAQELAQPLEAENLFVAANWFSGVSVNDCVTRGLEVAKKIQGLTAAGTA